MGRSLTLAFQMINLVRISHSYPKWHSVETGYNPEQLAAKGLAEQLSSGSLTIQGFELTVLWSSAQSCNHCVTPAGSDIEVFYLDFGVILNTVPRCTDSLLSGPASAKVKPVSAFLPRVLCQQYKQPVNVLIRARATLKHTLLPLQLPDKLPITLTEETRGRQSGGMTQHEHTMLGFLFSCYADKL